MPSRRELLAGVAGLAGTAVGTAPARATDPPSVTWERTYRPADRERASVEAVVPTGDGVVLVGLAGEGDQHRGWIGGIDTAGRSRWHRIEGTEWAGFFGGAPTDDGGVVAAGLANATLDVTGPDRAAPYLLRTGPDGGVSWARTYQPARPVGRASAVVAVADGYVVAGNTTVAGEDDERPWAARIDGHGIRCWTWQGDPAGTVNDAVSVPGGAVVAGSTWPPGVDGTERGSREGAWAARLAADGSLDWRWRVDRAGGDRIEALAPAPDGGVVALGRRGFSTDDRGVGWLVALDATGAQRWERTYPQEAWNWLDAIAPVDDGYVLAGTRETDPDTDDRGAWLLRVDGEGRSVWEHQVATGTRGQALLARPDGGLLVGGRRHADDRDGIAAWLAKLGGDAAPSSGGGPALPAVPGWAGPFLAGGVLGALGAGLARHWRRS